MEVIFYTSYAFMLAVCVISIVLAWRGNQAAKYFLWIWAVLMILTLLLMHQANMLLYIAAGLMLLFFFYVLNITVRYGMEHVDVCHEQTRRVLAESNRRIDEERRILARRLHDEINPQLLLARNVLKQLEPLVAENTRAAELLGNASRMLSDAYAEMRDIIKNTRIEVIDSLGLTAALESLVAHYTDMFEEPAITLEHNLPKRPELSEASGVSVYKIVREAIFNAIKHANAAQVRVSVQHNKAMDTYKVEVSDDGVGMKATARNAEHVGIGLIDMRERVRVLGGTLKVQAADSVNQKRPGTKLSFSFSGRLL